MSSDATSQVTTSTTPTAAAPSPSKSSPAPTAAAAAAQTATPVVPSSSEAPPPPASASASVTATVPAGPANPLDGLAPADLRKKLDASKKELRAYLEKKKKIDKDLVSRRFGVGFVLVCKSV